MPEFGARLLGFGAAQPRRAVSATELGAPFERDADWVETRTGIKQLRRIDGDERLLDLAVAAAADALAAAGLAADEIDFVIAATCSVRGGEEPLAPQISAMLAPSAATYDLNAACSGFCYALSAAEGMIRAGSARYVLIVGAEQMSDLIDPADLGTGIIFGDGAGAAVIGPVTGAQTEIGPVVWGSDGTQRELIAFDEPADESRSYMRMQGRQVFRWAVENIHRVALQACQRAGVEPSEIDIFVPHQANLRIVDAIATKLGFRDVVIADDIVNSGNTSAASIPIALTRLVADGRVRSGQLALLIGFGAGLAYAGQVVRMP
ncbi:3-oxoacyl-[acyl-carrier-protein] synthase-3 [Jatrophihabitans sp. GAS493]|nr:3-oxoacyl-[acyl-carrier-protein] synthase-3 [Jatrophihabitans sp. GAS493]